MINIIFRCELGHFTIQKNDGYLFYYYKGGLMEIIYLLIGVSFIVAIFFLGVFMWSVKSGQYEDDYTPSVRILFDDKQKQQQKQ